MNFAMTSICTDFQKGDFHSKILFDFNSSPQKTFYFELTEKILKHDNFCITVL